MHAVLPVGRAAVISSYPPYLIKHLYTKQVDLPFEAPATEGQTTLTLRLLTRSTSDKDSKATAASQAAAMVEGGTQGGGKGGSMGEVALDVSG